LWSDTNGLWREAQARFDAAFGKEASENLRRTMDLIASPGFAAAFSGAREDQD
jgi:hypothetical protein